MTGEVCPLSGKPLPDGFAIHPSMASRIRRLGGAIGLVMPAADDVKLGLARPGRRLGAGVRNPCSRLPVNAGVFDAVDECRDTVYTWAWHVLVFVHGGRAPVRSVYDLPWESVGRVIAGHAQALCRWREVAVMLDEVEYAVSRAERLSAPPPESVPVQCPQCYTVDYVRASESVFVCALCGVQVEVDTARKAMLASVFARPLTLRHLGAALSAFGYEVKPATLRSWVHRGKLRPVTKDPVRYRPQDAVALVEARRA